MPFACYTLDYDFWVRRSIRGCADAKSDLFLKITAISLGLSVKSTRGCQALCCFDIYLYISIISLGLSVKSMRGCQALCCYDIYLHISMGLLVNEMMHGCQIFFSIARVCWSMRGRADATSYLPYRYSLSWL
jgi:hypothetical protein